MIDQIPYFDFMNTQDNVIKFKMDKLEILSNNNLYIENVEIKISEDIVIIFKNTNNLIETYWQNHDLLGKIGDWINNIYIVNSGVPEGTGSYSGGTDIVVDPETHELVPNVYQKLYYEKYYRLNP